MKRVRSIFFLLGCVIGIVVVVGWELTNRGYIHIGKEEWYFLSELSEYICPSAFLGGGVDSSKPIGVSVLIIFILIIILNGVLYAAIGGMVFGLFRAIDNFLNPRKSTGSDLHS